MRDLLHVYLNKFECHFLRLHINKTKQEDGKDQETIQSSTTPDPGYHMEK